MTRQPGNITQSKSFTLLGGEIIFLSISDHLWLFSFQLQCPHNGVVSVRQWTTQLEKQSFDALINAEWCLSLISVRNIMWNIILSDKTNSQNKYKHIVKTSIFWYLFYFRSFHQNKWHFNKGTRHTKQNGTEEAALDSYRFHLSWKCAVLSVSRDDDEGILADADLII